MNWEPPESWEKRITMQENHRNAQTDSRMGFDTGDTPVTLTKV